MKMIAVYSHITKTWSLTTMDEDSLYGYDLSHRRKNIYFFVQVEMADV